MTPSDSILRTLRHMALALALGYCVGLVACQKPGTSICPSGRFCPDGSSCAAAQDVCIFGNCGNGKLDAGEPCDDGNVLDGDGCSSTCKSNETCGNGVWDPLAKNPEVCDWRLDPLNCSSDCLSNLTCGNATVDQGEDCDPVRSSPPVDTAYCTSHCTHTRRGDGWVNPIAWYGAEQCDRDGVGNTVTGATSDTCEWVGTVGTTLIACNADCTWSRHGDGRVNPSDGEECDYLGNGSPNPDPLTTCQSSICNWDCTWSSCGDGVRNPSAPNGGEQCDDAKADIQGDCTDACKWNRCGDGIRQLRGSRLEECDLGDATNVATTTGEPCNYGQTCNFCLSGTCAVATIVGPHCGDWSVNGGNEECDNQASLYCKTCDGTCQWVGLRAAQGSIEVMNATSVVAGDTITIEDGVSTTAAVLEFSDPSGNCTTAATNTCISMASLPDNNAVASRIRSATSGWAWRVKSVSRSGNLVTLRHDSEGAAYNIGIAVQGSSVAVWPAEAAVVVRGMSGGTGCLESGPCSTSWDCIGSLVCSGSHTCVPP